MMDNASQSINHEDDDWYGKIEQEVLFLNLRNPQVDTIDNRGNGLLSVQICEGRKIRIHYDAWHLKYGIYASVPEGTIHNLKEYLEGLLDGYEIVESICDGRPYTRKQAYRLYELKHDTEMSLTRGEVLQLLKDNYPLDWEAQLNELYSTGKCRYLRIKEYFVIDNNRGVTLTGEDALKRIQSDTKCA